MQSNKMKKPSIAPASPAELRSVKGMHDILPADFPAWEKIQKIYRELAEFYNFQPIQTPMLEDASLFSRSSGEESDIVAKEMFQLKTKGGDTLALRPEGTAGVVRSYIEHGMKNLAHPLKLCYFGPYFRYEQPQAGRERQFFQIGLEILSTENDPIYDAQIIQFTYRLFEELKIKGITIHINSIGCKTCRPNYRKALTSYYKAREKQICDDCKRRLPINPLRLLDCKKDQCKPIKESAPITCDYLCTPCKKHFKEVLDYLDHLKLPYLLNNFLVRGLDYYTKTVFEFYLDPVEGETAFNRALCGGGRYDYLVENLGGSATPAVGVGIGLSPIREVLKRREINLVGKPKDKVFLVHIGDLAKKRSLCLIETLRQAHVNVVEALGKESLAAQMRVADKIGAPFALIYGQKEAHEESVLIRDMKTGAQETVPIAKLADMIKKRLG
jgi:histidyl-tRNA synthetase